MKKFKVVSFIPQPLEAQKPWLFKHVDTDSIDFSVAEQGLSEEQVCELVSDCNLIIASPVMPYLNHKILESAEKLERVQFASVGYDKVDIAAADNLGIPVANNAGLNAVTVAEHAMMMLLVLQRKAFLMHNEVMQGIWPDVTPGDMWELRGRTLGILGLGAIGSELAKISSGFGVRILYNKRNRLSAEEEIALGVEYRPFSMLLEESDILSVHVPLNEETRHIIDYNEISSMKDGAILINTARKDVINEEAAAQALRNGKFYGVGIDVPKTSEDRSEELKTLFEGYNTIITSHTASASGQIMARFTDRLSQFVLRSVNGEPPLYPVNKAGQSKPNVGPIKSLVEKREIEKDLMNAGLDKDSITKFYKNDGRLRKRS